MNPTTKLMKAKARSDLQKIRVQFHDEHAQQVSLAGTFNDWRLDATPMPALGELGTP